MSVHLYYAENCFETGNTKAGEFYNIRKLKINYFAYSILKRPITRYFSLKNYKYHDLLKTAKLK